MTARSFRPEAERNLEAPSIRTICPSAPGQRQVSKSVGSKIEGENTMQKIVELKMRETKAIVGGQKIASVGPLGRLPPVVAEVVRFVEGLIKDLHQRPSPKAF